MSTTAPEYLSTLRDGIADAVQQWMDQSSAAWEQWATTWTPVAEAGATALGMPSLATAGARTRERRRGGERWGEGRAGWHHEGHHHQGHEGKWHHDHGYHGCSCGCGDDHHGSEHHPGGKHHTDSCGCCGDSCDCCVPEADVVVKARAGEVRVVPFRLRNPWRREREVTIEVGPWHHCDGDRLDVRARLEETKLVLKPCEDRVVRLVVTARALAGQDDDDVKQAQDAPAKETRATRTAKTAETRPSDLPTEREVGDVDDCSSAYADVRFEGCARPQRVALVVLPADCDSVDVGCDCGCCC